MYSASPVAQKYHLEEKITIPEFVSIIGGVLGSAFGFSFISSMEIAYYFIEPIRNWRKRLQNVI